MKKEFGSVYRKMRESKGLILKEVANENLSVSQLSSFERGVSTLTLDKFVIALENINVSMSEFISIYNDSQTKAEQMILTETHYDEVMDLEELHRKFRLSKDRLKKSPDDLPMFLNKVALQSRIYGITRENRPTAKEMEQLLSYFAKLKEYGMFETVLLIYMADSLDYDIFYGLVWQCLRSNFYAKADGLRAVKFRLLLSLIDQSEKNERLETVLYDISQFESLVSLRQEKWEQLLFSFLKISCSIQAGEKMYDIEQLKYWRDIIRLSRLFDVYDWMDKRIKKIEKLSKIE